MNNPTTDQMLAYVNALGAHVQYNFDTGNCDGNDDWCTAKYLAAMQPRSGLRSALLWPAYVGARLWIGLWVAVPFLFGYRFRMVVVNGQARSTFVRREGGHEPGPYEVAARKPVAKGRVKSAKR